MLFYPHIPDGTETRVLEVPSGSSGAGGGGGPGQTRALPLRCSAHLPPQDVSALTSHSSRGTPATHQVALMNGHPFLNTKVFSGPAFDCCL